MTTVKVRNSTSRFHGNDRQQRPWVFAPRFRRRAFGWRSQPAITRVKEAVAEIGSAVYHAIEELVPIIAGAPADDALRAKWLDRLWKALEEDQIPYIESLGDFWGELCASPQTASRWADEMVSVVRMAWSPDPALRGFYSGTALRWLAEGYGYDVMVLDVREAYRYTMHAAEIAGCAQQALERIHAIVAGEKRPGQFLGKALGLRS